jgi:glycosyltransferase involved in cell wall biosynthesis
MPSLISIITPVYNSERYLLEHLKSVQIQTYEHWEHILVDDCSSDGSGALIKKFQSKDQIIKYHRLEENSGAGIARNKAIEIAKGDYMAFLDSDDQWYSKKLEEQINFMKVNGYHFTFTAYDIVDANNRKLDITISSKPKVKCKSALYKNPIGCLTVIYDIKYYISLPLENVKIIHYG